MTSTRYYLPRDWATMKQGIFDFAKAAAPAGTTVYWGNQDAPSPPNPRLRLNVILPGAAIGQDELRSSGIVVIIDTVANSTLYRVTIGGDDHDYTSDADATDIEIRDGLIAAIAAGSQPVTPEALADDQILLRSETQPVTSVSAELSQKIRREAIGNRNLTVSMDAMADPLSDQATAIIESIRGALEHPAFYGILQLAGLAFIDVEGTRKGDLVTGAEWQDRAGFDLRLSCRSAQTALQDYIESAEVTSNLPGTPAP